MEIDDSTPGAGSVSIDREHDGKKRSVQTDESRVNKKSESRRTDSSLNNLDVLHLNELIRSAPDIRMPIVEQIKRDIHNGTYEVRAEKIAEKILESYLFDNLYQS